MAIKGLLPISSCWIVTEGLVGLENQAIGLAQALGTSYTLKKIQKQKGLGRFLGRSKHGLTAPWPDLLITCGRQSVAISIDIRKKSLGKTFTVHIQDPLVGVNQFDVVVAPAHDHVKGQNVCVTRGAVHHVTLDKLREAANHFRPLLASLPRPVITVLVGGKNRHQGFSPASAYDFAHKLGQAVSNSGGSLAVTFSRRTGAENEVTLRKELAQVPSYIWNNQGENPYFGLLSLADMIVVTSDSLSMISESCSTGKPVYIYELPHCGRRHKELAKSLIDAGHARPFLGTIEPWNNVPLDETRRAADFVYEHLIAKMEVNNNANFEPRSFA